MREMMHVLRARLQAFRKRRELERDLQDEIEFHLAEKQRSLEKEGAPASEAAAASKIRFGNTALTKERSREAWVFSGFENGLRDAKYAVRVLKKAPAFSVIAVLTLAFGIGANTAIFSVVHSVLLEALPYPEPGRLFKIQEVAQEGRKRTPFTCVNAGNFLLWTQQSHSGVEMALLTPSKDYLNRKDNTVEVTGVRASANLFQILGVQPWMGHTFSADQDFAGSTRSVILTHALWKRLFQSAPDIVGSIVHLNGYPVAVAGVLPESFYFPKQNDLYASTIAGWTRPIEYFTNLALRPDEIEPGVQRFNFAVLSRLRSGVSVEQATRQLDAAEAQVPLRGLSGVKMQVELVRLRSALVGGAERKLWLVTAAGALVLLLVCVNLAGLLIARGAARAHEIGVRAALGASRIDVVRQFLIEALILSCAGGSLGVALAYWGVRVLVRTATVNIPRLSAVTLDERVLLFSALLTVVAAVVFSLAPALWLSSRSSAGTVKESGRATTRSRGISWVHQTLTVVEIAFCTILLVAALLLAQSLVRVLRANAWGDTTHVLTLTFTAPPSRYQEPARRAQLITKVLRDARELAGVQAAGTTTALPFEGEMWNDGVDFKEDPKPENDRPTVNVRFVSPDYFRSAGIGLASGRFLADSDYGRPLVLISNRLAKQLPRAINPVGSHLSWTPPGAKAARSFEVAGVIADVRASPEEDAPPMVFVPYWVWSPYSISLVVRTSADPRMAAVELSRLIRQTDNQIAVPRVQSMRNILSDATAARRFVTSLGLLFAFSATLLAAMGLYGLISLSASQRTREIGLRMALGAQTREIFGMILGEAAKLTVVGLVCGMVAAFLVTSLLKAFLYEVQPTDAATFVVVCVGLLAIAALASYPPARRAAGIDPLIALRAD